MNAFVYPLLGSDGNERWYLINRGQVRAVIARPDCEASRQRTAELIRATFEEAIAPTVLGIGTVDSVLLVVAWFRRNGGEKERLMTGAESLEACCLVE